MKERLDQLLVDRSLFPSREKAKASIMAGLILVDGRVTDKAGALVNPAADIVIKEPLCPYVSRGGLKLAGALASFGLSLTGKVAIDMGASTGGFTDCMLSRGAVKVYAIDVGYGQLDWKLRQDSRVVNMEKTNIRHLDPTGFPEQADFISIDVSFISLGLILPVAAALLKQDGDLVCLVKPQFEAGREQVGKGGIVRDPAVHREVIAKVAGYGRALGLLPAGLTASPVTGAKGNIEYLLYFNRRAEALPDISRVVEDAHSR